MVEYTAVQSNEVEILDVEIEDMSGDAEAVLVQTDEEVEVEVGVSAGNSVTVSSDHFIAASINTETDEATAMMTGEESVNESSVFISNEEGEVGGGFLRVDEGDIQDAIDDFEEDYL